MYCVRTYLHTYLVYFWYNLRLSLNLHDCIDCSSTSLNWLTITAQTMERGEQRKPKVEVREILLIPSLCSFDSNIHKAKIYLSGWPNKIMPSCQVADFNAKQRVRHTFYTIPAIFLSLLLFEVASNLS